MNPRLRPARLLPLLTALCLLLGATAALPQTRQDAVHHMGHSVMPFDLDRTVHVFRMTETGGVQRVEVRKLSDGDQVAPIRRHLAQQARAFRRGDYAGPASLHGDTMPGLGELRAGAAKITVTYADLPAGAEIRFTASDIRLITAIHRWFGAQLSEHGADARAE